MNCTEPVRHMAAPASLAGSHGPWGPGVRLLRHMRFPAKAGLISFVLLVPALILGVAYIASEEEQVTFARKERAGVEALAHVVPVLHKAQVLRATLAAAAAEESFKKAVEPARADVDRELVSLDAYLRNSGDPIGIEAPMKEWRAAWSAVRGLGDASMHKPPKAVNDLNTATQHLLQHLTDDSNLILDPEVDTLYLVLATAVAMPKGSEDLTRVWGSALGGLAKGALEGPGQYRDHAIWQARSAGTISDAAASLQHVVDTNPALKARVQWAELDKVRAFVDKADVSSLVKDAMTLEEVYPQGVAALSSYYKVLASTLPVLDQLLSERVRGLQARLALRASIIGLSLIVGLYIFVAFARVMREGLDDMARHLQAMARGDLREAPRADGSDETATLLRTLAATQDAVRAIVHDVRATAENIAVASREIAVGSADLSRRSEHTAAKLQHASSSLEHVAASLGQTSSSTVQATGLSRRNSETAARNGQSITVAVETMVQIHAASNRIRDIIGTIDGIAFQTNILALNAAVEAARAGEQGRGFAVVASEVRVLAQRSAEAAREIKSLITGTVERVDAGTTVVQAAGDGVREAMGGVEAIDKLVSVIAATADRQHAQIREVSGSVAEVDALTQGNAALVEQTSAAAESLRQRAMELTAAVARFKLSDDERFAGPSASARAEVTAPA